MKKLSYNELLNKRRRMENEKHLSKSMGMAGLQANEQTAALVIAFYKLLNEKGDRATLGEIEAAGKAVQQRFATKQALQLTK